MDYLLPTPCTRLFVVVPSPPPINNHASTLTAQHSTSTTGRTLDHTARLLTLDNGSVLGCGDAGRRYGCDTQGGGTGQMDSGNHERKRRGRPLIVGTLPRTPCRSETCLLTCSARTYLTDNKLSGRFMGRSSSSRNLLHTTRATPGHSAARHLANEMRAGRGRGRKRRRTRREETEVQTRKGLGAAAGHGVYRINDGHPNLLCEAEGAW
ncbi:hypothetical protein LZ30DRAFT_721321 [Colletotrichum cereale]|nr:hypothetical protein LZ30DRAFT_721321 [Colletotrichum cereale]